MKTPANTLHTLQEEWVDIPEQVIHNLIQSTQLLGAGGGGGEEKKECKQLFNRRVLRAVFKEKANLGGTGSVGGKLLQTDRLCLPSTMLLQL